MTNEKLREISKDYAEKISQYVDENQLNDMEKADVLFICEDDDAENYASGQHVTVSFKINTEGDGLPEDFDMSEFWERDLDLKDSGLIELVKEYEQAIRQW